MSFGATWRWPVCAAAVFAGLTCLVPAVAFGAAEEARPEEPQGLEIVDIRKGDLDELVELRQVRALVVLSKTFYFLDGAEQRGLTYEMMRTFEADLNKRLGLETRPVQVIFIPVRRDELLPALVEGRGDIAAANLTVTKERRKLVDFAAPHLTGVDEILITGPSAPAVTSLKDLAGKAIHVRLSSSYHESLVAINKAFRAAGRRPIRLVPVDENLEDEDLLEMVNAGLLSMIVMDSHKAEFWAQIFPAITLHRDVVVRRGGEIAWAIRKNSPKLRTSIDQFVADHKKGTLVGNVLFERYLEDTQWVENAYADVDLERFLSNAELFQKYAGQYDFDWLMIAAQAYQESRIDQAKRSPAGAVGVMQVLPSTAAAPEVGIEDIHDIDNNVHAGVKYLRHVKDHYFSDPEIDPLNRALFSFASYNAGPTRISALRRKTAGAGLDPNVWFRNVELLAAKAIGREPVHYVSNVYKYYVAYRSILERLAEREAAKQRMLEQEAE